MKKTNSRKGIGDWKLPAPGAGGMAGGAGASASGKTTGVPRHASGWQPTTGWRFAVLAVLVICLIFAARLGIQDSTYGFQTAPSHSFGESRDGNEDWAGIGFASGNKVMVAIPHWKNSTTVAVFRGVGRIDGASVQFDESGLEIVRVLVGGVALCAPCRSTEKYALPAPANGSLEILVEARGAPFAFKPKLGGGAFILGGQTTSTLGQLVLETKGGWNAEENARMPSSFYGMDAPFHIFRIGVLSGYLQRLEWPWSAYGYFSVAAPAIMQLLTGISSQYAYKIYQIALFFVPIGLFCLFSRKEGGAAVFLFSSLAYLFTPTTGMITGGGPDLFMYGMTSHALATYLSLVFLYFAYEFVVEMRGRSLALALLFFAAACMSNQRIILAMWIGVAALVALALAWGRWKRAALLCAACLAFSAWAYVMQIQTLNIRGYSSLGGVVVDEWSRSAFNIIQTGHLLLPLLFAIGIAESYVKKERLALFLAASAILTYAIVASPEMNRQFPFMDGLRFMPSAFLPAMYVCGVGARNLYCHFLSVAASLQKKLGLPRADFAVAFALALLMPACAVFFVLAETTFVSYSQAMESPQIASTYFALEKAVGIVGQEKAVQVSTWRISPRPIIDFTGWRVAALGYPGPEELEAAMQKAGARYAIMGDHKFIDFGSGWTAPMWEEYEKVKASGIFEEIELGAPTKLFRLEGVEAKARYYASGMEVRGAEVKGDRARFSGVCNQDGCGIVINQKFPSEIACEGGCAASQTMNGTAIGGIAQGPFEVKVVPAHSSLEIAALALFAVVFTACHLIANSPGKFEV